jgi:peptidoglycan hydrolase CwlO-like protein
MAQRQTNIQEANFKITRNQRAIEQTTQEIRNIDGEIAEYTASISRYTGQLNQAQADYVRELQQTIVYLRQDKAQQQQEIQTIRNEMAVNIRHRDEQSTAWRAESDQQQAIYARVRAAQGQSG